MCGLLCSVNDQIIAAGLKLKDERESFRSMDTNRDDVLDDIEWIGFLHPEHSAATLHELAEDIVKAYGRFLHRIQREKA